MTIKMATGIKEVRLLTTDIHLVEERNESTEERKQIIEGYALKFQRKSEVLGRWVRFREILDPDCLHACDLSNVTALFNHDESKILGRTGVNVELEQDSIGLKFKVIPTDTTYARDLMENIRAGVVNQCSFAFTVAKDDGAEDWIESEEEGIDYERTIRTIDKIYDVSVVTTPAYTDTEAVVGARSKEIVERLEKEKRSITEQEEVELLALEVEAYA